MKLFLIISTDMESFWSYCVLFAEKEEIIHNTAPQRNKTLSILWYQCHMRTGWQCWGLHSDTSLRLWSAWLPWDTYSDTSVTRQWHKVWHLLWQSDTKQDTCDTQWNTETNSETKTQVTYSEIQRHTARHRETQWHRWLTVKYRDTQWHLL